MTVPALVLEHVSRHFGGLKAVDDVALTVAPGERHAVIGPAGKTTLFNLISGELPTTGRIVLFGTDVTRLARTSVRRSASPGPFRSRSSFRDSRSSKTCSSRPRRSTGGSFRCIAPFRPIRTSNRGRGS